MSEPKPLRSTDLILGRCVHQRKNYLLLYRGPTRKGYAAKVAVPDGSNTLWIDLRGEDDPALRVVKQYRNDLTPMTWDRLRSMREKFTAERSAELNGNIPAPRCWECGQAFARESTGIPPAKPYVPGILHSLRIRSDREYRPTEKHPWVARIYGVDGPHRLCRDFIRGSHDYSNCDKKGRGKEVCFLLAEEQVYEVFTPARYSGGDRHFCQWDAAAGYWRGLTEAETLAALQQVGKAYASCANHGGAA